jgi:Uncharacterized low-complexity proteins
MLKFDIHNRFTGAVQFTAKIDCPADAPRWRKLGLAVQWAIKARADLVEADLADANLVNADLVGANLARANLTRANLVNADLVEADLANANLAYANLVGANLARANLTRALCEFGALRGSRPIIQIGPDRL